MGDICKSIGICLAHELDNFYLFLLLILVFVGKVEVRTMGCTQQNFILFSLVFLLFVELVLFSCLLFIFIC
jgi:hypothetical protein